MNKDEAIKQFGKEFMEMIFRMAKSVNAQKIGIENEPQNNGSANQEPQRKT